MDQSKVKTAPPLVAGGSWDSTDARKRTDNRLRAVPVDPTGCMTGPEIRDWEDTIKDEVRYWHIQLCGKCSERIWKLKSGAQTPEQAFEEYRAEVLSRSPRTAPGVYLTDDSRPSETQALPAPTPGMEAGKPKTSRLRRLRDAAVGTITGIFRRKDLKF